MAFYIKKPSLINSQVTVYYRGANRWSDNFADRLIFDEDPTSLMENPNGTNGGWKNATVVSE